MTDSQFFPYKVICQLLSLNKFQFETIVQYWRYHNKYKPTRQSGFFISIHRRKFTFGGVGEIKNHGHRPCGFYFQQRDQRNNGQGQLNPGIEKEAHQKSVCCVLSTAGPQEQLTVAIESWYRKRSTLEVRVVCIFSSGTKGTIDKGN